MQHEEGEGGAEEDGGQVALPAAPGHRLLPLGALTLQQRALVGESSIHRNRCIGHFGGKIGICNG